MTINQVDLLATHYYSHKFVCVAPYSTDTLLLINIPKTKLVFNSSSLECHYVVNWW